MHIYHKDDVNSPLVTGQGEVIYELIGRTVGESTERHSLAYVVIPPGKSAPLHNHPEAEESYYILKGEAQMVLGDEEAIVGPGQAILIPPSSPHKISSIGEDDLELLAVCVPAWEPTNTVGMED
ncbi:MAG: cupin domain-containing protein [Chloroflexota bacterium]|nr:cupin domain-containing protein [Chloroflexota bacterium]